ncbi:MAG: hypothetical protein EPO68_16240, partial [Planctomycetota bacterium]
MNALRLLLAALLVASSALAQRVALANVDVRGPCSGLTAQLELAGTGPTAIPLDVPDGSTQRVLLPLLLPPDLVADDLATLRAPSLAPDGGRASFAGWNQPSTLARWADVPSGLRARPRTAPPELRAAPSLVACALLVAAGCAVLALKRAAARVAIGVCAVLAGWAIAPQGDGRLATTVVWEFDAGVSRGLAWSNARDRISIPSEGLVHALADPPALPIGARIDGSTWTWRAEGARLWIAREADPAWLTRGELFYAWTRRAGGEWVALGGPDSPEPPGWLVTGLPMGVDVVLGLRFPGSEDAWPWVR